MLKSLLICTALISSPALAQMSNAGGMEHSGGMAGMTGMSEPDNGAMQGMQHGQMDSAETGSMGMAGMMDGADGGDMMGGMMERMQSMLGKMMMQQMMGQMMMDQMGGMDQSSMMGGKHGQEQGVGGSPLSEPGQSAFAAIAEVVRQLESDPNTDWNNVTIDVLREHLRDMDVVMIDSSAIAEDIEGGVRFTITGSPTVAPSIIRMALGHASVMDGVDDWNYSAEALDNGAILTVLVPEADLAKLKALGFYGMLASGMHHQPHHWMMANGGGMGG